MSRPRSAAHIRSHPRLRLNLLRAAVLAVLAALLLRLFSLQILDHDRYRVAAEGNRERTVAGPAPRGTIVDDKGVELALNKTSLVVTVDRSVLARQPDRGKAVLTRLARTLHRSYTELSGKLRLCTAKVGKPCWNGSPYQPVPVLADVSPQLALAIMEHPERYPGVSADLRAVRSYPLGAAAAHEIGYTGPASQAQLADPTGGYVATDAVGQSGIEASYDSALRGKSGVKTLAVDRFGNVSGVVRATAATPGDTVVLSLDSGVQQLLLQSLASGMAAARFTGTAPTAASGVVLDWHTGNVIAMASVPSYDPSAFTGGISQTAYDALTGKDSGDPLVSRAYQSTLAPGSTFKPVSLSSAVASGKDINGIYGCPSAIQIGSAVFHNFEGEAGGDINLHEALVMSCDTIFDQFAYDDWLADGGLRNGKGPYPPAREVFTAMAKGYGFGKPTGVDLPYESGGWVTDRAALVKQWNQLRPTYCKRARIGYPEDPDRMHATLLQQYAAEACKDGFLYNGGAAVMFGIGQGAYLSVSPLQLATAYAAVANGGTVYRPRLAKALVAPDGTVTRIRPPVAGRLPVAPSILTYLRDALLDVPRRGTAAGAFTGFPLDRIPIAGKTGTAEVEGHADTSWFASFSSRYVVVICLPDTGQGGMFAAPVARQVYEGLYGVGRPAVLPEPPAGLPATLRTGA